MSQKFLDATLILIGHGSTVTPESAAPVRQHAAELRRRGLFGQVLEALWKEEPSLSSALAEARTARVFIVPLFISDGYFTLEVIPRALGLPIGADGRLIRERRDGARTVQYCEPVGTHPGMTDLVMARAQDVVRRFPFPRPPRNEETALLIAGHGTVRNASSRCSIEDQVARVRSRQIYAEVHAVFLEESPRISDCYALTERKHLVMVPFFISDGLHSYQDIPVLLGEPERVVQERLAKGKPTWRNPTEKKGRLVWYARSPGTDPGLADVIVERVLQCAALG